MGERLTDPDAIAAALDAAESRALGHAVYMLRMAWRLRHDAPTQGRRITRRQSVAWAVSELRGLRQVIGQRLPILPRRCGDVGTVESRHVWGPGGPDPRECACDACRKEVGRG